MNPFEVSSEVFGRGKEVVLWAVFDDQRRKYRVPKNTNTQEIVIDALQMFGLVIAPEENINWDAYIGHELIDQSKEIGFYRRMLRENHHKLKIKFNEKTPMSDAKKEMLQQPNPDELKLFENFFDMTIDDAFE